MATTFKYATEGNIVKLIQLLKTKLSDYLTADEITEEINNSIKDMTHISFKKVDQLPEIGETKFIYLVPNTDGDGNNIYKEYFWVEEDSKFELLGTIDIQKIDLSGYVTKEELDEKDYVTNTSLEAKDYVTNTSLEARLEDYVLVDNMVAIEDSEIVAAWNEVMANLSDE